MWPLLYERWDNRSCRDVDESQIPALRASASASRRRCSSAHARPRDLQLPNRTAPLRADWFFRDARASSRACCGRVVKPHGRLVLVSSTCCHASTSSLSNSSSRSALQGTEVPGKSHLEVGFPLRCFQRLSDPNLATQLCSWRNNWFTSGSSIPVLSY